RRQSEIMLYTVPDAEKGSPVENKAKWLREETNRTGATGGIFYIMKFCEPEYFYYPQLKIYLANHNIRTFVVEYEMTGKISKQNINRIQSFIEGL
ncbi:MAG: 2-hydroxyacyl-CoA dehydratase family protein, partial [Deltaproteobacteria bacterium]|nr:2-hydroxyacyl-CoA dehydratase family protein [Deltaproteobacteria bacterium]